ncbi:MAG: glycoside hydrolase family 28 protein [Lachnospiraceae bacterium]|nr:glycoside hydrolase family 28 protein [Lachnospiraceae bacterium]
MKRGLNAICYEQEMHLYFERTTSLMEGEFYEIVLSDGQCIQTKKTNVSFYELKESTRYEAKLFLCLNSKRVLLDKAVFTTTAFRPRLDVTKAPYFAIGDGKTLNTKALQRALDEADGRVVYFPNGKYLTGALTLHSGTELYLEEDAVIMGSDDPKDYLPLVSSRSEGLHMLCYQSLINVGDIDKDGACNTRNIIIRGGSIIGGGIPLMERMEESAIEFTREYIDSLSEEELATFDRGIATINGRLRGRLIEARNTENVVISNVSLSKGPYWNVHFIYCDNVVVHGCDINTRGIHNGDGLNPDSSTNVTVFNCTFDTGDNCIAIKSGRNPEGNVVKRPTKHLRIFDIKGAGGGIAIGSELSGGCEDVVVWNVDLTMSSVGFVIKTTRKRGGLIKDIHVYDSIMPNVRISAVYSCNNDGEGAGELTRLEDISYENCVLLGQAYTIFYGEENINKVEKTDKPSIGLIGFEEEQTFKNISFSDIKLKKKEQSVRHYFELDNLSGVHFGSMETIE